MRGMVHERVEGRNGAGGRQARAAVPGGWALLVALPLLGGCIGSPGEGPLDFVRALRGDDLEGRAMPPGIAGSYPNLASVPLAPARGQASTREALSAALAANRAQAGQAVIPDAAVPDPPASEGATEIPRAPPAPPRLAAAPPIGPGAGVSLLRAEVADPGSVAPAAPSDELLAPPPADLSAPPPPVLAPPRTR